MIDTLESANIALKSTWPKEMIYIPFRKKKKRKRDKNMKGVMLYLIPCHFFPLK